VKVPAGFRVALSSSSNDEQWVKELESAANGNLVQHQSRRGSNNGCEATSVASAKRSLEEQIRKAGYGGKVIVIYLQEEASGRFFPFLAPNGVTLE